MFLSAPGFSCRNILGGCKIGFVAPTGESSNFIVEDLNSVLATDCGDEHGLPELFSILMSASVKRHIQQKN